MPSELQRMLKCALVLAYEKGVFNSENGLDNHIDKVVNEDLLPTLINETFGVEKLSKSGKKPEAMSIYREITDCSLKEAKAYVDQF